MIISKNAQNEIFKLTVVSGVPQLPEGMELIGLESEINPDNIDLSISSAYVVDGKSIIAEDSAKVSVARQAKANEIFGAYTNACEKL